MLPGLDFCHALTKRREANKENKNGNENESGFEMNPKKRTRMTRMENVPATTKVTKVLATSQLPLKRESKVTPTKE
jgi:hypothetical protein